jgi:hypothetical protein
MTKIICDANVWYQLGEKEIKIGEYELVPTFVNMIELAKTRNHLEWRSHCSVGNAANVLIDWIENARLDPVVVHAIKLDNPSSVYDCNAGMFEELQFLGHLAKGERLRSQQDRERQVDRYGRFQIFLTNWANFMNSECGRIRAKKLTKRNIDKQTQMRRIRRF